MRSTCLCRASCIFIKIAPPTGRGCKHACGRTWLQNSVAGGWGLLFNLKGRREIYVLAIFIHRYRGRVVRWEKRFSENERMQCGKSWFAAACEWRFSETAPSSLAFLDIFITNNFEHFIFNSLWLYEWKL